jgi:hypothetical protein
MDPKLQHRVQRYGWDRAVSAEYLDSIAAYRRSDDQYDIPGEFVVVAGDKE